MENREALTTLSDIRKLMEKSTKFLSLSGLAPILVGIYACIVIAVVFIFFGHIELGKPILDINTPAKLNLIIFIALALLIVSVATTFILAYRKNKKSIKLDATLKRLLWSFSVPLAVGGILCVSLIMNAHYGLMSSVMLIFYGLALVNASTHTYSNTRYLGYAQLILGLTDCFVPGYAIIFWGAGFGLCHIIYGVTFYMKYDRKVAK